MVKSMAILFLSLLLLAVCTNSSHADRSKHKKEKFSEVSAVDPVSSSSRKTMSMFPIKVPLAKLIAAKAEYRRKTAAIDKDDFQDHETLAIWCHNRGLKDEYIRNHLIFLESRGENARKKDIDGYCRVCSGQEEYLCDKCDLKRRTDINCRECNGNGKVNCSRCLGTGKIKCLRCGGSGRRKKNVYVIGAKGGIKTRMVPCLTKIRCATCRGKKLVKCKPCRGKGVEKKGGVCTACNGYRFRVCTVCEERYLELQQRIQSSYLAWKHTAPPEAPEEEKVQTPPDHEVDGNSLVAKGNALMTEGLALDKQSLTSNNPFPLMKKADKKYQEAINCYKAAQRTGSDVSKKLQEALRSLFWIRKMMPIG